MMDIRPLKLSTVNRPYLVQLVGLFLIVLTFFIMLVSISQQSVKKQAAAAHSVMRAFSGDARYGASEETILRQQLAAGLSRQMYGPLSSAFPGEDLTIEPHAGKVAIRLPLDAFFAPQKSTLLLAQQPFITALVALLGHASHSITQELTVTLRTSDLTAAAQALATNRAGVLTRALLAGGAPVEQIAAAVEFSEKDDIVLYLGLFITDKNAAMRYIETLWQKRPEAMPRAAGQNSAP